MSIDDLIQEGEAVKQKCSKEGHYGNTFLTGEDYEKWIAKCILFMEKNHKGSPLYGRLIEASKNAVGNDESYYNTIMGILKAIKEMD